MSDDIIKVALKVLEERMKYGDEEMQFNSPDDSKNYVKLALGEHESEVFGVLFLNNQHQLISFDKMFFGTIDSASVYPRDIAKRCLEHNASAIILTHNHPSGCSNPSQSDIEITSKIKQAMSLFDIRVLDHLIVGRTVSSLAESGQM